MFVCIWVHDGYTAVVVNRLRVEILMLPKTLVYFITYWISLLSGTYHPEDHSIHTAGPHLTFQLQQQHAISEMSRNVFANIPPRDSYKSELNTHAIKTRITKVYKPHSNKAFARARLRSLRFAESELIRWKEEDVIGPDVEDRETLQTLAKMTYNAYLNKSEASWYDLGDKWSTVSIPNSSVCESYFVLFSLRMIICVGLSLRSARYFLITFSFMEYDAHERTNHGLTILFLFAVLPFRLGARR